MTALYAWGANSHGQLGLGYVSEQVCEEIVGFYCTIINEADFFLVYLILDFIYYLLLLWT